MKTSGFISYIFKRFPLLSAVNIGLLIFSSFLEAVSVFSLVVLIDLFINPGLEGASVFTKTVLKFLQFLGIPSAMGWLLAFFMLFILLKIGLQIFSQYTIFKTKYAVLGDVMTGTFRDFFGAKWYFFTSGSQGVFINTFIREVNIVGDAFASMARYFSGIIQVVLYLFVPFIISWQVTLISVVIALVFTLPFFLLGKIGYRWGKINTSTANNMGSVIQESLNSAKIILGFANQAKSVKSLSEAFKAHQKITVKLQTLTFSIPLLYYPFGMAVLIIGVFIAKRFALPLSETAVLFYSLMKIIPLIGYLTEQKAYMHNFLPSYEQVMNLREKALELKQPQGKISFDGFNQEIRARNLTFAYPGHSPSLVGLNILIPKGKMIAFAGESGAGKSTLIDMIMGFHEPGQGDIYVDGVPLREYEINSYRQRIGYVPQESILFNMSIQDNLRWAKEDASEQEINRACSLANAEEFIKRLPGGYNTVVGDRGVRLSGGQIQRLALARAILRRPQLLILDEATSSLDTNSERLIQQAIEKIARETTLIVIAHRLSTIVRADYIYLLNNGKIEEEGSFGDLARGSGNFSKMVKLQGLETANEIR